MRYDWKLDRGFFTFSRVFREHKGSKKQELSSMAGEDRSKILVNLHVFSILEPVNEIDMIIQYK